MDNIDVVKLPSAASNENLQMLSYQLDLECNRIALKEVNWPTECSNLPDVHFRIAHNDRYLFLKFDVRENEFRATELTDRGAVWEDSCVELFIQPENDQGYYNLEFNAIGTVLVGYGEGRARRMTCDSEITNSILRDSILKWNNEDRNAAHYEWSLTVKIPYTVFFKHTFIPEPGVILKANLYKCGNKLPHPHFISWHPIKTEKPDFHRPEYFGTLTFK